MSLRSAFAITATRLLDEDERLVILLGDIGVWAMRAAMAKHPQRCLNIGVMEQGSVSFGAGLAMQGYVPIFHTIDSFMVRRAYEQIYIGFGLQKLPGVFISVGGTSDYAKLGPTHECPEGPTLMAQIPGMHIRIPVSEATVDLAITTAVRQRQLSYIRLEESLAVQDASSLLLDNVPPLGASNGHAISPGAQR
jgi:transketolase